MCPRQTISAGSGLERFTKAMESASPALDKGALNGCGPVRTRSVPPLSIADSRYLALASGRRAGPHVFPYGRSYGCSYTRPYSDHVRVAWLRCRSAPVSWLAHVADNPSSRWWESR